MSESYSQLKYPLNPVCNSRSSFDSQKIFWSGLVVALIVFASFTTAVSAATLRPEIKDFITLMADRHQFNHNELEAVFAQAETRADVIRLMSAPVSPTTSVSWDKYRERFVNTRRIREGAAFWRRYADVLARASTTYGVPEEIIVAIIGVETAYGTVTGVHRVIDALTTLAFDYPRRADFFRGELEHYLLLTREQRLNPLSIKGSYAGAIGIPQFMPGSYRRYAVDFDGDGRADLSGSVADAIGSVGNYLQAHGWAVNKPVAVRARVKGKGFQQFLDTGLEPQHTMQQLQAADVTPLEAIDDNDQAAFIELNRQGKRQFWLGLQNFYVITRYNRSTFYAMSVFQLAEALRAVHDAGH